MGVRGLASYVDKNSKQYLRTYDLHDTYLVIDGNNLAAQLYVKHTICYDCFGGEYDTYRRTIKDFFDILKTCNVTPLIVFDGCYENKKLKTIYSRVNARIQMVSKLNAYTESASTVFPLFLRELFTEVVLSLGLKAVRCDFEADYEMACMASTLDCPLLSYDSDFFIFDIKYIPFPTLQFYYKTITVNDRTCSAIECKLYKVETFLSALGAVDKSNMPLLATLLGNDYIKKSYFKKFYDQLKLVKKKSSQSELHRRIESVIKWLQDETYESAARKILGMIKFKKREEVAKKIKFIADGYICVKSKILCNFGINIDTEVTVKKMADIDISTIKNEDSIDTSESDDEEISDEEDIEMDNIQSIEVDTLTAFFPSWFVTEFRSSNFPAWFLDIAIHKRYFFIPQVENKDLEHSNSISIPLLAALHKMLSSGNQEEYVYVARKKSKICSVTMKCSDLDLPTLAEIEHMDTLTRCNVLLKIVDINSNCMTCLNTFPPDWQVFILAIMYWVKNADMTITNNYVYSLIMCVIILKNVDKKFGKSIRTINKLCNYMHGLKKNDLHYAELEECGYFLQEMIPKFYMHEKMCRNPKNYDSNIVHAFAQFQSCAFHIKYLNKLLKLPFEDFNISEFFNGTFIYNFYCTLLRRPSSLDYIQFILKRCPDIFKYFKEMAELITNTLEMQAVVGKKRHRKANRK
ncbi:PREDICTED: protein asteroid [Nicrophorus vespilloides]|uniref:Protein asteroid n=1 Tax=Nicrophorus vespilloides TaxID=110193 RepID=A0ABM1MDM2_NICVS|nr:PREDICTED: protein asteroid [Nicrophorus vespilloides]